MFILVGSVNAQQNLAQEAYAIFEQSCLICHGENGSYRESLIIEHKALIEGGTVIPGNPGDSVFYQRLIETNIAKRMPQGQPPLDPEAIETIRQWIAAGAPDWDAVPRPKPDFITTDAMLETIENHVNSLSVRDKSFARYFTLTHLYNAGETTEALNAYRRALSKLINSLSWGREVVKPQPIDVEQTLFYIDLRDYEWDVRNDAWTQIEQAYPYKMTFDAPTQAHLREKLTTLQQEMNCEVPFINVDWFLATASLPPLYHDILALPQTDRELEAALEVFVAENLQNAPGKRVWRAGFNNSRVSRHNRVLERHKSRYGAYWKSYDFAGSSESQSILTHPLDFSQDGGEIIFNLPNGLQAYLIVDREGIRLDAAPISIVSNPAASDPTVRTGLSCIGCHTKGMQTFEDEVRAVVEQADSPPFNKEQALDLYVVKSVMDDLVAEDMKRFRVALEETGGVFGGIEPVQRLHEAFQAPLSAAHAAAAVGLETGTFLEKISNNVSLQNLLGALVLENGVIKRDAWTSAFHDVVAALDSPNTVLPPIVERPERIPGAGVHIPDVNLRTAIDQRLELRHGKAPGDVITVEDMAKLKLLKIVDKGIQDLTGLQFATNLQSLAASDNQIFDLLPLQELIKLESINLKNNAVSDLSPLSGLKNLREINLEGNLVSDLSPFKNLKKLGSLRLWDCPVSDLSPLAGLTELTELNLADQRWYNLGLIDLLPLAGLTKMENLTIHNLQLSSGLAPLASLINLKYLKFDTNNVTDVSHLANLINLESITTWGNPISDFSPLAKFTKLKKVDICGANITDLSFLAEKPELTELYLVKNSISDITPLAELTGLIRLNLEGNNISNVSPLAALTQLEWLKLTHNPITDFSPLDELFENTKILFDVIIPDVNLRAAITEVLGKEDATVPITLAEITSLTTLRVSNKDIKDLTGIEYATNLMELSINHNPISDLSPLTRLAKMREVYFNDTQVSNLLPLASLHNLEVINASETRISSLAPLAGLTKLKKLDTVHSDITDLSPLVGLTDLTRLRLYDCKVKDLSPLRGLTKLTWLGLTHTDSIIDFSPLSGLTDLKHLALSNTEISDISPLAGLVNLEALILNENRIVDVSPLASLRNLKNLQLHENNISDFSALAGIRETIEVFTWFGNPAFPQGGPNIVGPWLWLTLPVKVDKDVDYLAKASNNKSAEQQVATISASEGTVIGNNAWSVGMLEPYHPNDSKGNKTNLRRLLDSQDAIAPNIYEQTFVVYGSMTLHSPRIQQTKIFIGASVGQKVYLNGKLVHQDYTDYAFGAHNVGYRTFFSVTLQKGINVLLVRLDELKAHNDLWSLFFGFEDGTEYTVIHPDTVSRPTFSTMETANLLAGDTFTLNFNAENITDLAGWQAEIAFDPNVLEAVEVTEGDFLKTDGGNTFFQAGTIDHTAGKITGLYSARIAESGVSGTGMLMSVTFKAKAGGETQVTLENFEFSSISGAIIPTVPPNITITVGDYPAWDVNQDGRVSIQDLVLVAKDFGSGAPANLRTDVNRDGVINIQDLILVAQHFGDSADSTAASPILATDNKELMPIMVQTWIDQAQVENDGSIAFRQGIENLERLLASLLPEKTALLANYPNPFNPETWIPYQLAKPAEVTLTIYATNGAVVRTLALGHQAAGIYQSRSRAAHWDGRNSVGESVASSIYFYTLTAGDFMATRRMLILK